jgi:hypothetical protein
MNMNGNQLERKDFEFCVLSSGRMKLKNGSYGNKCANRRVSTR